MPTTSIPMPSATSAMPKWSGAAALFSSSASCAFWNTWKMVKPNPMSDSEVRITDISVRSALMRVRWNDIPVRRAESSTEMRSELDSEVTRTLDGSSMPSFSDHARFPERAQDHLDGERDLEHAGYRADDLQHQDRGPAHDPARVHHRQEVEHHHHQQDREDELSASGVGAVAEDGRAAMP